MKVTLIGGRKPGPHKRNYGVFLSFDTGNFVVGIRHMKMDIGAVGSGTRWVSHYFYVNLVPFITLVIHWSGERPDTEGYGDLEEAS